ncbi:MAG: DNA-binding transcriptional activator DevR/DosR [Luteibacter sp.]|uniref:response regulator transcription factor n=1 Tax=Luteibacter sp. TaxID=1886636 RepID=UPI001382DCA1|nr:response regulator transcription factor [Luteibacter sp.]KAF1007238.1 MAG: DNA-binding transcriptional activator DevR/DosR [Luteibacter sp.]
MHEKRAWVVDDDPVVRERLSGLLREVLGGDASLTLAEDIASARAQFDGSRDGLALVDIGLPDGNGVDLIAWLQHHHPQVTTVVVSAYGAEDTVLAALRAGAAGYLLKERDDSELLLSLQSIKRGGALIDPFVAKRILALLPEEHEPAPEAPRKTALSDREAEILRLVARGYSNREIAKLTSLSRFTIEDYTKKIYRKLSVGSRTAAVFEAKAMGWLN